MKKIKQVFFLFCVFSALLLAVNIQLQPCIASDTPMVDIWYSLESNQTNDVTGYNVAVTMDGAYLAGNFTNKSLLGKYDNSGSCVWHVLSNFSTSSIARGVSTVNETVYLAGSFLDATSGRYDAFLAKYDSQAMLIWCRKWSRQYDDEAYSVAAGSDAIYVMGNTQREEPGYDDNVFLAKYDLNGNVLWNHTWGGASEDHGRSVVIAADGIYISGYTYSFGLSSAAFIAKYSSSGTSLWNRTWNDENDENYDFGHGLAVASDGIYLSGTAHQQVILNSNVFIAKYTSSGTSLWNSTWGGSEDDYGAGLVVSDDEIFITGLTKSYGDINGDAFLAKFNSTGALEWNLTWGGPGEDLGWGAALGVDGIFITGYDSTAGMIRNAFIAKFSYSPAPSPEPITPSDEFTLDFYSFLAGFGGGVFALGIIFTITKLIRRK